MKQDLQKGFSYPLDHPSFLLYTPQVSFFFSSSLLFFTRTRLRSVAFVFETSHRQTEQQHSGCLLIESCHLFFLFRRRSSRHRRLLLPCFSLISPQQRAAPLYTPIFLIVRYNTEELQELSYREITLCVESSGRLQAFVIVNNFFFPFLLSDGNNKSLGDLFTLCFLIFQKMMAWPDRSGWTGHKALE